MTPVKAAIEQAVKNARFANRGAIKWRKEGHQLRAEMYEECRAHWIGQARNLSDPETALMYNCLEG